MKCLRVLVGCPSIYQVTLLEQSTTPCWCTSAIEQLRVEWTIYQSEVYNVTVAAEETSAEVSIAIFDDSIVEVNETFTADLSVPVAEAALGVSVSATDSTAYVEIQDDDLAYITSRNMSYQVTKGSGCVTVRLLVLGQVSVEFIVVVDITGGTATESSDYVGQMLM